MFKTNIDIYSTDSTVIRPSVITIVEDIKKLINLRSKIYTSYDDKDKIYKVKNKQGKLEGKIASEDEFIKVKYDDKISHENHELALTVINPDSIPIYVDKDISSSAAIIYHKRELNIEFTYGCNSSSKMTALINRLRLMTSSDGMYSTHDLEYSFVLPTKFIKLLNNVNVLKNKRYTSPIDFETYVISTFDKRLVLNNDHGGDLAKCDLSIKEAQLDTVGYITDDLSSIASEPVDNGKETITLNYKVVFESPVSIQTIYPLLVFNSRIDKEFRTFIEEKGFLDKGLRGYGVRGLYDITQRATNNLTFAKSKYYLTIPANDGLVLPQPEPYTVRLFSSLIMVDENEPRFLFNLNSIPGMAFKEAILNFLLTSEASFINDIYKSIFYFELYIYGIRSRIKLLIDALGNLYTDVDLSLLKTYRLCISIVSDTDLLVKAAKDRLKTYIQEELDKIKEEIQNRTLSSDYNKQPKTDEPPSSFIDNYITLLSIPDATVEGAMVKSSYRDIIFNIKEPLWNKYFTRETIVNLTGFMKELK